MPALFRWSALLTMLSLLAACGSTPQQTASGQDSSGAPPSSPAPASRGGGFYLDDGPSLNPPAGLANTPDPLPSVVPFASGPNRPYTVFGRRYVPDTSGAPFVQEGVASWYGRRYHGRQTSSGEIYDMYAMTAAHPTLPIPSYARVTRLDTGQQVLVRINDRGPFLQERVIDLSYAAATRLGFVQAGQARVRVERLMPDEIARIRSERMQGQAQAQPVTIGTPTVSAVGLPSAPPQLAAPTQPLPPLASSPNVAASAPQAPTAAVPAPPAAGGFSPGFSSDVASAHFVQFGAFGNPDNARRLLDQIRAELGTRSEALDVWHDGQLWRVQLGPLASRGQAEQVMQEIQTGTGRQVTIVRR